MAPIRPPSIESPSYRQPLNTLEYGQCTWYAFGRTLEVADVMLPLPTSGRDANKWPSLLPGYLKTDRPVRHSIAVWEGGPGNVLGHVAFIEDVDKSDVFFTEANVLTYGKGGGYDGSIKCKPIPQFANRGGNIGRLLTVILLRAPFHFERSETRGFA